MYTVEIRSKRSGHLLCLLSAYRVLRRLKDAKDRPSDHFQPTGSSFDSIQEPDTRRHDEPFSILDNDC